MTNDGKSWFTNGKDNILLNAGDEIPDGFHKGRVIGKKKSQGVCYNNGIENRYIKEGDPIPEGFVKGMKQRSKEVNEMSNKQREETNIKKYGVKNPSQSEVIKKKKLDTYREHYGVDNPSQADEVKQQKVITSRENWNTDHPMQSQEVLDKMRSTNLEKRGVEFVWQSEEAKEKAKQTSLERYGTEYPTQSKEVRDKTEATNIEKYGVNNTLQVKEFQEKARQTNLERYGTENPLSSDIVKNKIRQNNLDKYGVEYYQQTEEYREKFRKTSLERYGVDNPSKSDEIRDKIKKAWDTEETRSKYRSSNMEKYGVPYSCMIFRENGSNDSSENREMEELLKLKSISYEREFHISYYSYDFKIGDILIEIDPYPYHNTAWDPHGKPRITRDYHQKKSQVGEEAGFRVIHIFDWDDRDRVIDSVFNRGFEVYARKSELREVPKEECKDFLNKHHLQGSCKNQDICLGLYYENELISLMTFGKPRYNSNYEYELLRYCSIKSVVGGAEKLFKHFIKTYNPASIVSYCDRSKFRGDVYKKLGFTLKSEGKPSCHWYRHKDAKHFTDNLVRQRGVDQLLGTSYGKGTSNEELLVKEGFVPIFDCGQDTYIWKR